MKHQDAIILFIFNEDNSKILMLNRVKKFGFDWGYMCGKVEEGEDIENALNREVREELGIKLEKVVFLKKKELNKDGETFFHYYFKTNLLENTKLYLQKEEINEAKWFLLNELPKIRAPDDPIDFV